MARQSKPHLSKGYWRCRIAGTTHYLGKDRRQAFTKFYRLMALRGDVPRSDRPVTVNGAIEAWLLLHPGQDNVNRLRDLVRFAGADYLADVDASVLERYAEYLRGVRGLAPKTVIDRVGIAARIFAHAAHRSRRWIRDIPDKPRLEKPARVPRDIPPDQLNRVFDRLPVNGRTARVSRILRFILATGCRPSEACRLDWQHVRLDKQTATLPTHKTAGKGKVRTLYLSSEAMGILAEMPERVETGPVFLNGEGRPYKVNGLRSILRRRGVTGPYTLRHTYGQTRSEQLTLQDLAKQMGHSDLKTTQHYFEVREERAREVASELPPMLGSPTAPEDDGAVIIKMPQVASA